VRGDNLRKLSHRKEQEGKRNGGEELRKGETSPNTIQNLSPLNALGGVVFVHVAGVRMKNAQGGGREKTMRRKGEEWLYATRKVLPVKNVGRKPRAERAKNTIEKERARGDRSPYRGTKF